MPTVFIPKEVVPGETRVAATPETVKRMVKTGFKVIVESGAGAGSYISDDAFREAGADVSADTGASWGAADVVLKLHPPRFNEAAKAFEADMFKEGAVGVSFLYPYQNLDTVKQLAKKKVTAFAMDLIPRITRAQSMDALSSQANIAGYKAVLMAAEALPRIFPLLMTAAGTIKPAKVVIMGAGVAGLQAIATAKRLGAIVEVSDIRPAVKEQVQSLGAKFIEIEGAENMETEGGYAKEVSAEFLKKQQDLVRQHMAEADVVITTALVPGKKAPILVTAETVKAMRDGSVIVDLATEQGGNCELSEPGKTVVKEGVTIIGTQNIPGTVAFHASDVYAKNILYVINHLFPKGEAKLDLEDEINKGAILTHAGEIRDPQVAAKAQENGGS
ncbi:MAG: Re/Si-specific NAD(P)(+) transhydrogenase subunit alpha [Deltaproteobacteria bacterium]|nr:Re/Si-specific NAD(P)(+) transhydrogenase subunit alpha [Deltaproteobacteria bacterium]